MFLKAKLILKAPLNKLTEIMYSNEYNGKCVLRKQVTVKQISICLISILKNMY